MNNFNSYLSILSAVDSGPVQRLDWPRFIIDVSCHFNWILIISFSFSTEFIDEISRISKSSRC
jgi:hypothetical protein